MRGLGGMRLPSKLDQKMFVQLKCSFPNGGVNQQQAFRTNPTQTPPLLGGWLSLSVVPVFHAAAARAENPQIPASLSELRTPKIKKMAQTICPNPFMMQTQRWT